MRWMCLFSQGVKCWLAYLFPQEVEHLVFWVTELLSDEN